jgi:glycosyltransferase involved in cell wall biosynthesis
MSDSKDERIRLLEYQLDYLRAELLRHVHERDENVYSAAWLLFKPLRRAEAQLVQAFGALRNRFGAPRIAPILPARHAAEPTPALGAPPRRLLVDVTGTIKRDAGTGIQRVVKKVVEALYSAQTYEIPSLAVRAQDGRLFSAHAFAASLSGATPREADREIEPEPGDRLLLLSDSWNAFDELAPLFARIRARGGEIISCVFDLIPALHPHACHEVTPPLYDAWLRRALVESDAFLAISHTVAEELADFVEQRGLAHRPGLKIGWFRCGGDIAARSAATPRTKVRAAVEGAAPVFLCVGTIEPRKGQRVALRAFERLWRQGIDARVVFVGRRGWLDEAISAELLQHPEQGGRLFWFDDAGDAELDYLYSNAKGLVLASFAEGFGLPIVEAARRGVAVVCSDIPVFREVGRDGALYFRVNDAEALAERLKQVLDGEIGAEPAKVLRESWADAARRITEVIAREDWSRRLSQSPEP